MPVVTGACTHRKECPVRVAIFCMLGYFHTITWLREYPCVETISFTFFDHMRLQTWGTRSALTEQKYDGWIIHSIAAKYRTCEPVSILWRGTLVSAFQNRICLSAVPPPDASKPLWCGDHATAFTWRFQRKTTWCCHHAFVCNRKTKGKWSQPTAAEWSSNLQIGSLQRPCPASHTNNLLSLPLWRLIA